MFGGIGDRLYADYNFDGSTWRTVTLSHDDAGNLTNDGLFKYTYDAWNRLVGVWYAAGSTTISGQRVARYEYDGLFRRIEKEIGNQGTGVVPGSDAGVVELTGEDGSVVERYEYDAYGEPLALRGGASAESGGAMLCSSVGNPLMHQGLWRDGETGSYQNRYRQYWSAVVSRVGGAWMTSRIAPRAPGGGRPGLGSLLSAMLIVLLDTPANCSAAEVPRSYSFPLSFDELGLTPNELADVYDNLDDWHPPLLPEGDWGPLLGPPAENDMGPPEDSDDP